MTSEVGLYRKTKAKKWLLLGTRQQYPNCYIIRRLGVLKEGRVAERRQSEMKNGKSGTHLRNVSFAFALTLPV
jgi:hypothetical protein